MVVGDCYVVEVMKKDGYNVGGEQLGYFIFFDYNMIGDGLLFVIMLMNILKVIGKLLLEFVVEMQKFLQLLVNVRVIDKYKVEENEKVKVVIFEVEKEMNGDGWILVCFLGIELLVCVMVEVKMKELCDEYVNCIVEVVWLEMGLE